MMCRTSSVGSREKGLKGREGEEEEESGGRAGREVILLDLSTKGGVRQHIPTLLVYSPSMSALSARGCSRSEMIKWESLREDKDSLEIRSTILQDYLQVFSVCLLRISVLVRCCCQRFEPIRFFPCNLSLLDLQGHANPPGRHSRAIEQLVTQVE